MVASSARRLVIGRAGGSAGKVPVQFGARPAPQPSDPTRTWAFDQFQDLEQVISGLSARIVELERQLAALQVIAGDGTWDG